MKIAVYPGSFDPVTNGHLDIIKRAAAIFDKVVVAILQNSSKNPAFSISERIEMLSIVTKNIENVQIDTFEGLLVNYIKKIDAGIIIKGLRAVSDFEYEFQMALMNKRLEKNAETFFMMTNESYSFLSSSVVKEIAMYKGGLKGLVPDEILNIIKNKYK